jgi:hypothetical protein
MTKQKQCAVWAPPPRQGPAPANGMTAPPRLTPRPGARPALQPPARARGAKCGAAAASPAAARVEGFGGNREAICPFPIGDWICVVGLAGLGLDSCRLELLHLLLTVVAAGGGGWRAGGGGWRAQGWHAAESPSDGGEWP